MSRYGFFRVILVVAVTLLSAPAPAASLHPAVDAASVAVGDDVATPLHPDDAALAKMPLQRIEASAHDVSGVGEGVAVADILRAAGAPFGEQLRRKNLASHPHHFRRKQKKGHLAAAVFSFLVEAAGIEPASEGAPRPALHA